MTAPDEPIDMAEVLGTDSLIEALRAGEPPAGDVAEALDAFRVDVGQMIRSATAQIERYRRIEAAAQRLIEADRAHSIFEFLAAFAQLRDALQTPSEENP